MISLKFPSNYFKAIIKVMTYDIIDINSSHISIKLQDYFI